MTAVARVSDLTCIFDSGSNWRKVSFTALHSNALSSSRSVISLALGHPTLRPFPMDEESAKIDITMGSGSSILVTSGSDLPSAVSMLSELRVIGVIFEISRL